MPGQVCCSWTTLYHFRSPGYSEAKEVFQLHSASGEDNLDLLPSRKETYLLLPEDKRSPAASCLAGCSFYTLLSSAWHTVIESQNGWGGKGPLKGPTLLQQAGTPSARRGSWQSLPQFSVARPTLNTQNWGEGSQELCTGQRKRVSVLPVPAPGIECQHRRIVAGKDRVCRFSF